MLSHASGLLEHIGLQGPFPPLLVQSVFGTLILRGKISNVKQKKGKEYKAPPVILKEVKARKVRGTSRG
jgi:hypothetical protein